MRIPLIALITFLVLTLGSDAFIFYLSRSLRNRFRALRYILYGFYALEYALLIAAIIIPARSGDADMLVTKMWLLFAFLTIIIPKLLLCIFGAIACLPALWHRPRWRICILLGTCAATLLFIAMWWGALVTRFDLKVHQIEISSPEIPESFDGYRIIQFSDLHLGTFGTDTTYVSQMVDCINSLEPDLIVFTGDLVNRTADELRPFIPVLSRLRAPDGVISIMGNHDYGDYYDWDSPPDKENSLREFHRMQRDMGWNLLLNQHTFLHLTSDTIAVIGVENVGDPPFIRYGNLQEAYPALTDSVPKILLSHNPAHWEADIKDSPANIFLTLSGHTHAMQMRFFSWSPAAWRYRYWDGLYSDSTGHSLFVDTGVGTVGFPMRLGVSPRITLITLRHR